jgi:hypothetical protein
MVRPRAPTRYFNAYKTGHRPAARLKISPPVTFGSLFTAHARNVRHNAFPLTEFHHPATFQSRGVAAPFTTPMLAGARVREAKNTGVELVVPNPSGGRGVYILHWIGVQALCNPTLHDTVLFRRLSTLPAIDPASVRDAAWKVAIEGYAGRQAMAAGETALANDRSERLLANFRLIMRLLEQVEPKGTMARTPDLARRATDALHLLAPSLGRPAARLTSDLAAMGDAFAPLGIAPEDRNGRIPRTIARLEETGAELSQWLEEDAGHEFGGVGRAVAEMMMMAFRNAGAVLEIAHAALSDPKELLERWVKDAGGVLALASRCDWLLDGWERVCLIWHVSNSSASRRASLLEMGPLVPVLPREILEWTGVTIAPEAMDQNCRVTSCEDSWRKGAAAFNLVERNEHLRAMSH